MTCTDKDIQRLKELLPLIDTYGHWQALLTRLEKAEACAKGLEEMYYQFEHADHAQGLLVMGEAQDQLKEWLASKGEGK